MRFKDFFQEDQSGSDKGLMGYGLPSPIRKPSDGQPFSRFLTSVAGSYNSGGNSSMPEQKPMFMKKKMKKV